MSEPRLKRILVTGSRDWTDWPRLCSGLNAETGGGAVIVIHGGARGADSMAGAWASLAPRAQQEVHHAAWETYGKRAGFVRNQEMVDAGADVCLAFIRNNSKGATMCARLAEKAGIPVKYFRIDDE